MKTLHFDYNFEHGDLKLAEDPDLKLAAMHTHSFDEIAIILGGTSIHTIGKEEYPLMRGDVFVIHGNQAHGNKRMSDFHIFNICYDRRYFEKISEKLEDFPCFKMLFYYEPCFRQNQKFKARLHLNPHQLNHIMHLLDLMKEERNALRSGHKIIIKNLFEMLIIDLCRCYSDIDTPHSNQLFTVGKTIDYLEKNYSNEISLAFLAQRVQMPESTFARTFKKTTGCSPIDYLIKLRIEKAAEMMENNPHLSVTDIAMTTGFWNSSYFTRKFKKIMGMTPMAFLKKQRGRK
jgi:AraC-like DNA-binding protein